MNTPSSTNTFLSPLSSVIALLQARGSVFWQALGNREKNLICLAGLIIVLGSVYTLFVSPAHTGITRLNAQLPTLQAKLEQVQQLAKQIQSNPAQNTNQQIRNAAGLQTGLMNMGISAKVSAAAPWLIKIESAPGEALLQWLRANPASKMQLVRTPSGAWQGELTLEN